MHRNKRRAVFLSCKKLTTVKKLKSEQLEANMKLLSQLSIGESATVIAVNGEGAIRRRLFDMGITPGVDVYLRKKAPLGDPIEISLRGYELTLRKAEASLVQVK